MKEHLVRMVVDLFYTACYIFLTHTGYNISDKIVDNVKGVELNIVAWISAATIMFFLTKQRYDKETREGEEAKDDEF